MIETLLIVALLSLGAAKKLPKNPVFGQMTLTGEKALDWLKSSECEKKAGFSIVVEKILFCDPGTVKSQGWNIPEWAMEKVAVAILFPRGYAVNPVLVYAKSAVMGIERLCADWEAQGVQVTPKGHGGEVDFVDQAVELVFRRGSGKFDPYIVEQLPMPE
jgi:hypothetical protein